MFNLIKECDYMRGISFFRPRTELGLQGGLIAVPIVLIFIWLFNSYQLGKFGNKKKFSANSKSFVVIILLLSLSQQAL